MPSVTTMTFALAMLIANIPTSAGSCIHQDGKWGSESMTALQEFLNEEGADVNVVADVVRPAQELPRTAHGGALRQATAATAAVAEDASADAQCGPGTLGPCPDGLTCKCTLPPPFVVKQCFCSDGGEFDYSTTAALQKFLNEARVEDQEIVEVDGDFGSETIKALQTFLNAVLRLESDFRPLSVDGKFGSNTVEALQLFLNKNDPSCSVSLRGSYANLTLNNQVFENTTASITSAEDGGASPERAAGFLGRAPPAEAAPAASVPLVLLP